MTFVTARTLRETKNEAEDGVHPDVSHPETAQLPSALSICKITLARKRAR
ncbi:MAG: hypothetical protein HC853_18455 [Anaerolineae bacterium]|nr:hypothetical protein [Anaerolineae bacterium]